MREMTMSHRATDRRSGQSGFALILAILSLMLLTFLGLTLAASTSTELQIATNFRWSQQALYNAEAGLEAAKIVLSRVANVTTQWQTNLPPLRVGTWTRAATPAPGGPAVGRDYERSAAALGGPTQDTCDSSPAGTARGGVGYGRVLTEGAVRYEDVSTFSGQTLNGAFTIWVRRALQTGNDGTISDNTRNDELILAAEGVAPYTGAATAITRAQQARKMLETRLTLSLSTVGNPCLGTQAGQEGGSPMGENFNPCAPITAGATGSLAGAFGGAGSGGLTGTGVQ
jgi:Tfp pilus assembly protein PilV